jgi:hypothetical protein
MFVEGTADVKKCNKSRRKQQINEVSGSNSHSYEDDCLLGRCST